MGSMHERSVYAQDTAERCSRDAQSCELCAMAGIHTALGVHDELLWEATRAVSAADQACGRGRCTAYDGAVMAMTSFVANGPLRSAIGAEAETTFVHDLPHALARRLRNRFFDQYGTLECSGITEEVGMSGKSTTATGMLRCSGVYSKAAGWAVELVCRQLSSDAIDIETAQAWFRDAQDRRYTSTSAS